MIYRLKIWKPLKISIKYRLTFCNQLFRLWNPKIHCYIHESSPLLTRSSSSFYFCKIHLNRPMIHLRLRIPSSLLAISFPIRILKTFLLSSVLLISIFYIFNKNIRWTIQIAKFLVMKLSLFSSLLGPNVRLWFLFLKTLILWSFIKVSNPYSTIDNTIILYYFLIFRFLDWCRERTE